MTIPAALRYGLRRRYAFEQPLLSIFPGSLSLRSVIMKRSLTAIIERDGSGYVSLCPELDIASQGESVEAARENLREALELFFETAPADEVSRRLSDSV